MNKKKGRIRDGVFILRVQAVDTCVLYGENGVINWVLNIQVFGRMPVIGLLA
jgi:hypothetical protein